MTSRPKQNSRWVFCRETHRLALVLARSSVLVKYAVKNILYKAGKLVTATVRAQEGQSARLTVSLLEDFE